MSRRMACLRHCHAPNSLKKSLLLPHHRLFPSSTLLWLHDVKAHLFHEHFERVFWGSHRPRYQLCPLKISPKCWSDLLVFLHNNLVKLMPYNLSLLTYFETESTVVFLQLVLLRLHVCHCFCKLEGKSDHHHTQGDCFSVFLSFFSSKIASLLKSTQIK